MTAPLPADMAPSIETNGGPPLSIRPFPVADKKPQNIAEFIARVNIQPGGFRALNSDTLRTELEDRRSRGEDVDKVEDDSSDAEEVEEDDAPKDLNQLRSEVLKNIDVASNTAMLTLDSLSLLLSKQNPTQASVTLSQDLRNMAGIGTLGADKLHESIKTPSKVKEQETVAMGWTLLEINKTQEAAEEAAKFLDKEMDLETRYWEDVIKIQKAGWSICKMPQETSALAVRYGFSEAIPEFQRSGLAPLRRSEDAGVHLSLGAIGRTPKRVRVTLEKDGEVVGRSALPAAADEEANLEERVLEARNNIFARELWHELVRESKHLLAYDVKLQGNQIVCSTNPSLRMILELADLQAVPSSDQELPANIIAKSISKSLRLLLSYAHRYNELMRTRPIPPHISRSRGQQTYALLRPIIARNILLRNITSCTEWVSSLVGALKGAGFPTSFTLATMQVSLPELRTNSDEPNKASAAQALIRDLLQPRDFTIKVTYLPDVLFTIRGRTFLYPVTTTQYNIVCPAESRLPSICSIPRDGFVDLQSLKDFLQTATATVLARHYTDKLNAGSSSEPSQTNTTWGQSVKLTSIKNFNSDSFELFFAVDLSQSDPTLDQPEVVTGSLTTSNGKPDVKKWRWLAHSAEAKKMDDVVDEIVKQATP